MGVRFYKTNNKASQPSNTCHYLKYEKINFSCQAKSTRQKWF